MYFLFNVDNYRLSSMIYTVANRFNENRLLVMGYSVTRNRT